MTDPKTVNGDGPATLLPEILFLKIDHRLEPSETRSGLSLVVYSPQVSPDAQFNIAIVPHEDTAVEHQVSASIARFLPICGGLPRPASTGILLGRPERS